MYVYIRLGCGRLTPKITDRNSLIVGVLAMRARLTFRGLVLDPVHRFENFA